METGALGQSAAQRRADTTHVNHRAISMCKTQRPVTILQLHSYSGDASMSLRCLSGSLFLSLFLDDLVPIRDYRFRMITHSPGLSPPDVKVAINNVGRLRPRFRSRISFGDDVVRTSRQFESRSMKSQHPRRRGLRLMLRSRSNPARSQRAESRRISRI